MTYNVFSGTLNPTHFTSLQLEIGETADAVCPCTGEVVCRAVHSD